MTPAQRVLEALLWRYRPGKGLCLPYEAIAEAAHYCRRTIADALARLKRLGLITVHRRLKRIKTTLGFKVVQDWNAYELHPPRQPARRAVIRWASIRVQFLHS
jgi:hypothetical protein